MTPAEGFGGRPRHGPCPPTHSGWRRLDPLRTLGEREGKTRLCSACPLKERPHWPATRATCARTANIGGEFVAGVLSHRHPAASEAAHPVSGVLRCALSGTPRRCRRTPLCPRAPMDGRFCGHARENLAMQTIVLSLRENKLMTVADSGGSDAGRPSCCHFRRFAPRLRVESRSLTRSWTESRSDTRETCEASARSKQPCRRSEPTRTLSRPSSA